MHFTVIIGNRNCLGWWCLIGEDEEEFGRRSAFLAFLYPPALKSTYARMSVHGTMTGDLLPEQYLCEVHVRQHASLVAAPSSSMHQARPTSAAKVPLVQTSGEQRQLNSVDQASTILDTLISEMLSRATERSLVCTVCQLQTDNLASVESSTSLRRKVSTPLNNLWTSSSEKPR